MRVENPDALQKLHYLKGDVLTDNLGLSESDADLLKSCVNIVIHSAATVCFNEPIRKAIDLNVLGTRRVLELCRDASQLKVR